VESLSVVPLSTPSHPLDPLTAEEFARAREILAGAGKLGPSVRTPVVLLDEPAKDAVLAWQPGDPIDRRVRATLLDVATGRAAETVVSVTGGAIASYTELDPLTDGQPQILFEEYERCDAIVKADEGWQKAMALRGVTEFALVIVCPLSPGWFPEAGEQGRRMLRSLTFLRCHEGDNPWGHPVEGLLADVDLTEGRVIRLLDTGVVPIPTECGNIDAAAIGPARTSTKPVHITQPEGASFQVDGHEVAWEGWKLRVGFDAREGLTLHQISYADRPIMYRASIAEMVVPYGDPDPTRRWISYFDAGEYLLGRNANALKLGCDCLGEIYYFDAVLHDDSGHPLVAENAICLHEEDHGLLWKHTDIFTGDVASRRSRRLVISFIATVGNYDYAFYWYLYQDGGIGFEVKATGVLFTAGGSGSTPYANEVAPGVRAPYHQHLFCARLDMTVDGVRNTVEEIDVVPIPIGPDNPTGNAFTASATPIRTQAGRNADTSVARRWRIANPASLNRLGEPVAYTLVPQPGPTLLAQEGSTLRERAAFATKHLWVTKYAADQRHPAGERPNQHPGGAGIAAWTSGAGAEVSVENEDVVLWHVFGPTHLPRSEEWPVMPVDSAGFTLKPTGFFDRNPGLDVPPTASESHGAVATACAAEGEGGVEGGEGAACCH
jgi:primary-amine oxidase